MSEIVLEGIGAKFGDVKALGEVSLTIPHGEFLVLLGPSGCGKSTLLRILAGLLKPSSGRVVVDGRDVTALPPGDRDLAMVFQSYALYPHLSVERNIGFGLRVRHRPSTEVASKVAAVAEQLELTSLLRRRPRELSGGQRQRVALGRAIARDPKAFLMDEPLSNLDARLRTATRLELTELHRRLGTTFVYVTHDQIEAMTMATRIAVLNKGQVEQVGTPAEVYDEPASVFVAGFIGSPPMNLLEAKIQTTNGRVLAEAEGLRHEIAVGFQAERDVVLGVRPEHLELGGTDGGTGLELVGTVVAVENLGSEEVAICAIGDAQAALRGPRPLGVATGERLVLRAPRERVYLFDRHSGRRLIWIDETDHATPSANRSKHPRADALL